MEALTITRLPRHLAEKITNLSYPAIFLLWVIVNLAFTAAYFVLHVNAPEHGPLLPKSPDIWTDVGNSLYFSIITATTTGYGDIVPQGWSKVFAAAESVIAFVLFAIFVTKLASHRQDAALREVHKMAFEDIFYNIRQGLFVTRKDLDAVITKAKDQRMLLERSWETLSTAFLHAQSLIQDIPDFYTSKNSLYNIDAKREQLLLEAVHRTLKRTMELLDTLAEARIDWRSHTEVAEQLEELLRVTLNVLPLWQKHSSYERDDFFRRIAEIVRNIRERHRL